MEKKKESKLRKLTTSRKRIKKYGRKVTRVNLVNYVTRYVSKAKEYIKDGMVYKSWAWVYFFGVRMFNMSHKHLNPVQKSKGLYVCIGIINMASGDEFIFARYKEAENTFYDGVG